MEMKAIVLLLIGASVTWALPHPDDYHEVPKPYSFSYGIQDPYAGSHFGQKEKSDGKSVKGSYTVQLPDGRKQIVDYLADHHNGFVAKVRYEGIAQYPSKVGPPIVFSPSKGGHY